MKKETPLLLGAHLSVAGGLENALYTGKELGCTAVQFFTHSNRQWHMKPLHEEELEKFATARRETGIEQIVVHASYLINLASAKPENRTKSRHTIMKEIERCEQLSIPYLVLHPGSYVGATKEEGLAHLIEGLDEALEQVPGNTIILLENMAGQGSSLGQQLEDLAYIREQAHHKKRIGVCIDTCHLFAAGYDFDTPHTYETFWDQFEKIIGLEQLKTIHVNDSKKPKGSNVDRHAHIGEGEIGVEAFRLLMNDKRLTHIPKIIETPKDDDHLEHDRKNLTVLRELVRP